jgi:amino acid adenylation domain-containing protein/non-ribosomal peptide synthase protein (TIGR01720 family)
MNRKNIEAVYNLSPLQEGMQFHNLLSPDSKSYFQQLCCHLEGNLNFEVFQRAWQKVVERHDILRTAFVWEGLEKTLQVVQKEVEFKINIYSFEEFIESEKQQKLQELLIKDREQGIEFSKAPLMRILLIKTDKNHFFMVWSHHHILLDGWSLTILLKEIFSIYEAEIHGFNISLPTPQPYREYIKWINSRDSAEAKNYWEQRLNKITHPSRPAIQKNTAPVFEQKQQFVELQKVLDSEITNKINIFTKENLLTLNTLTQGAWAYLLSRYCGEEKIIFGVTINGRPTEIPNSENMVGLFINTLPICIDVNPQIPLKQWLAEIQKQQGDLEQFSYSSLIDVHGWSQVPRTIPLFETILVFENFPFTDTAKSADFGIKINSAYLNEQTNYPVTAVAVPGEQITLLLSYNTVLFDHEAIESLLENWASVLTSIALDSPKKLDGIKMVSDFEENQLTSFQTNRFSLTDDENFLHKIFERKALQTPQNIAIVSETEEISFEKLNRFANQLADFLIENGITLEKCVGICLARRWQMIGAMLAVLKSGGVYIPLNPETPFERLKFMVDDASISAVITEKEFIELLPIKNLTTFVVDLDQEKLASKKSENPDVKISPDNAAYIIYTSGSTGNPKGVVALHQGIANFTLDIIKKLGLNETHRMLEFAPLSFDASAIQIYPPLLAGGAVVLNKKVTELSNPEILNYCIEKKVSVIDFPSGYFHQWLDEIEIKGIKIPSQIKIFLTGGDRLSVIKLKQWARLAQAKALFLSSYGPTETTVSATVFITTRDEILRTAIENSQMGNALSNVQVYVIDPNWFQLSPLGVGGELYISGSGLARNYLNSADLTAEKFIPNPFSTIKGSRMYKTGDIVKYLPNGSLEFFGRNDHQVKIRGLRIEIGEIERELKKHNEINEAVVLAIDTENGEKTLSGFIKTVGNADISLLSLRNHLKQFLPDYMIPASFYRVEQFPLLSSGKIDRQKLLITENYAKLGNFEEFLSPRNPIEQTVSEIWKSVLNQEIISLNQNFFELGGHSLIATQLISRIRNVFQIEIPLRSLFQNPTIAEFSLFLQNNLLKNNAKQLPLIGKETRPEKIPLSFSQERLWFIERLLNENSIFNLTGILKIEGEINLPVLQQSLNTIIRRHEVLRTSFIEEVGKPLQFIHPERLIEVKVTKITESSNKKIDDIVKEKVSDEINTPFNIAKDVLIRSEFLDFGNNLQFLLLTVHHIVSDGWSMGIFAREIARIYMNLTGGKPIELPELTFQYADYALWQRNWLLSSGYNDELEYWTENLENLPPSPEIPTDFDRPIVQTYAGSQEQIEFSLELSNSLNKTARQEGVTLFMLLLAAYKLLLYKYLGKTDIFIGTPIAGRQQFETEGLIGFFLNTLVLRTDLSGNPTFKQVLKKVRETCLNAYSNQNIPIEKLIEILKPERDRSRPPLVQTIFNMLNLEEEKIELENLTITGILPEDQWSKFDLTIYAGERKNKIFLNLVYSTSLYDVKTIKQILIHYQNLLVEIQQNAGEHLDSYTIVSKENLKEIYAANRFFAKENSGHKIKYEFASNIVTQFEIQAQKFSDKTALCSAAEKVSYQKLNFSSNCIANILCESLAGTDNNGVGLLMRHNPRMIEAIFGTLKSGRYYVPLDSFHPTQRLAEILLDSDSLSLLTENSMLREAEKIRQIILEKSPERTLKIINIENFIDNSNFNSLPETVSGENTAYIIYTSGSTGKPKGIFQNHQNLLKHIQNYSKSLEISENDKVLLLASYSFDASIMDIFAALMNGAELYLYDLRQTGFENLESFIQKHKITVFHSTPTVFRSFAKNLRGKHLFPTIKRLVLGGEEVFNTDVELFNRYFCEQAVLINGLGPTESTLALQYFIPFGAKVNRNSVPIGFPVENTNILLWDETEKEVGIFGTGEIVIESDSLALGYWKRDDLTKQAFKAPDSKTRKRIYKTGDLGKRLPDYNLLYLGRKDSQIKIRGQRVEIGEIEARLNSLPKIELSAVIIRAENGDNPFLVAFVSTFENEPIQPNEIKQQLRKILPDFMIPQVIQVVKLIPLTLTGKIDRQKLGQIEISSFEVEKAFELPQSYTQKILLSIWKEILNIENLGVTDDFFAVGGHSLIATQVITRTRKELGVNLELREIFEFPTVKMLAERIDEINESAGQKSLKIIPARTTNINLPLANAQKRLWFLNELEPGNPAYNMSIGFKVTGKLNHSALKQALNQLLKRHESLRTVIVESNGLPYQIVKDFKEINLNLSDLSGEIILNKEVVAKKLVRQAIRKPFELSTGPLIRHLVVKLTNESYLMVFCLHHIICDGWSIGVFTRELAVLYMSYFSENKTPVASLPLQYADFAVWQNSELNKSELDNQIDYWKKKLGNNLASLKLPYDRPLPNELTYKGEHLTFKISNEIIGELNKICRQNGATMFMLMLTAWKILFMRYCNQDEIVIGIPVAGRSHQGTEGLIGMFVNTLVIRTFLSSSLTFEEALAEVKKGCLEAYAHQDLPFETLVSALKPTRDLSRVPLFEVMFNWLNFYENPEEIARSTNILSKVGLNLEQMSVENNLTKFDISLILSENENGLSGVVEFNTMLFDKITIERMLKNFEQLLKSILNFKGNQIGKLPILFSKEKAQILEYSQNLTEKVENVFTATQYFEKQAKENPQNTAVLFKNESLTYQELEERANQLAHFLIAKGIGAEKTVGVCLERSLEMVIATVAVVKTGAAYVPLDPEYPAERIRYMIEDSKAELLLTTADFISLFVENNNLVIDLNMIKDEIAEKPKTNPENKVVADNLFYIIYTSGSTGMPKGSMNTHRGVCNRLLWMQNHYCFENSDRILQMSSFGFDFSNWEIFGTLAAGAVLIIPEPGAQHDFDYVAKLVQEQNITIAHFVPSQLQLFLESKNVNNCRSLKRIFCGGEALSKQLVEKCLSKLSATLHNQYGPTETSIDVTYWDYPDNYAQEVIPIGQPNANNRVYILDSFGTPVPIGSIGEIFIAGEAPGRGYIGKPADTAERFMPDPFPLKPGERMYKTGDLGKFNNQGQIEYTGRADYQLKLRGFRIEPGEIEKVLVESRLVKDVTVTLYKPTEPEEKLVAYLVITDGITVTIQDLRELLALKLPHYMIPSAFVIMEKLPLTANGKLDRQALPDPEKQTLDLGSDFERPTSEIEEKLCKVWTEVLGLETVGINDNFFALGGDSILSIQIVVKAREYGLNFNPRQIFKYQTISELSPFTDYKQKIKAEQGVLEGKFLLSPIQEDFFERKLEEPNNYSQAILIDVGSEIEPQIIKHCVEILINHHDVLRSRFQQADGFYEQIILKHEPAEFFDVTDLSNYTKEKQQVLLAAAVDQTRKQIFIDKGPVFKAHLINFGQTEGWRLLLAAHHLVVDGVSWRLIGDHLSKLYQSASKNEKPGLGEKTCSYNQWSSMIRSSFEHEKAFTKAAVWLNNLGNSEILWKVDEPEGENAEQFSERVSNRLDSDETAILLNEIPKSYNSQIINLLLIAWMRAVNEWTGGEKVLVAVEGHGRDEVESIDVTATVGWFTTVTPILLHLAENESLPGQINKNAEIIKNCLDNGFFFRHLKQFGTETERDHLRNEWQPKVSFNYLGQIRNNESVHQSWKLAAESPGGSIVNRNQRQYELDVNLLVIDGKLESNITFSNRRYQTENIIKLLNLFNENLKYLIRQKDQIPAEIENEKNKELIKEFDQAELDEILAEVEFEM